MNTNPYSYDQVLAIIHLCVGLERHTQHEPDASHIRVLGINLTSKILEINHSDRISLVKEVVEYL